MKRITSFIKKPGINFCAVVGALALIFLCFFNFRRQVDAYIDEDMHTQIEAIQKNSTLLIQNEMNYLKRLTASAALMMSHVEIQTDEDILKILDNYAEASDIVRSLFVTLDGHAYTSYAGYLGQSDENTSIDGKLLSEITEPIFTQPYYAKDLDEVIFGVIAPVTMGDKQGVLVSSYNIKEFSRLLGNGHISGLAKIGIVDSRGMVVSGRNENEFGWDIFDDLKKVTFKSSSAEMMQANMAGGQSGFSIYSVDGTAHYCSYAPIGLNDWYVVVMIKESSLRSRLADLEQYGFQLTLELVIIMLGLLCVIIVSRLEEQKKIRSILERAAMMDGLTGVYNRKATEQTVNQRLWEAGEGICAALLVIDLDDFKQINDRGGHLFGDRVLKECADRLTNTFGEMGIVGRIGGDEFAVFLPDVREAEHIEEKVRGLNDDFYVPNDSGKQQKISISVGFAQPDQEADSFELLYQLADAALYRAKQTGKGKLSI